MKRTGRIISISPGEALVAIDGLGQCQRCAKGGGCGVGIFGATAGSEITLNCPTNVELSPTQRVTVTIDEQGNHWLWAVFGAYGLPTLGLLFAALMGAWFVEPMLPQWLAALGFQQLSAMADSSAGLYDMVTIICAGIGLFGGVIAWRFMAPQALALCQQSLCLHSARIVAVDPLNLGEPE